MKYTVVITETLQRKIEVEAESEREAIGEVEERWYGSEIVLIADDFTRVEFSVAEDTE